jgi:hypothetical protein
MYALALFLAPVLVSAAAVNSGASTRAAYFLDNNPAGGSIVSLQIAEDGTLSYPVRTSTGGKGLFALTAGTNGAAAAAGGAGKTNELPTPKSDLTFSRYSFHPRFCGGFW